MNQVCNGIFCKGISLPIDRFSKKKINKNGYMMICKMCFHNGKNMSFVPGICEFCKKLHDCAYGSGRFCNGSCRSLYSKNANPCEYINVNPKKDEAEFKICYRSECMYAGKKQEITNFYYKSVIKKGVKTKIRRSECKFCSKKRVIDYKATLDGFIKGMYGGAKRRAERKTMQFLITENDVKKLWEIQHKKCAISGMEMTFYCGKKKNTARHPFNMSLDRIDSKQGYIQNNIQLLCNWMQSAKSDFDEDNFKKWIVIASYNIERKD